MKNPVKLLPKPREPDIDATPRHGRGAQTLGQYAPAARRAAGWTGSALLFIAPLAILSILAIFVLYVRLSHGPISLKPLVEPIARGISAEVGGLTARIEDVVLRLTDDRRLEFQIVGLQLVDADGSAVISAPTAVVELSPSALLAMRVAPRRVQLVKPILALAYSNEVGLSLDVPKAIAAGGGENGTAEGSVAASMSAQGAAAESSISLKRIDLARVIAEHSARARRGLDATSSLQEVVLRDATLLLEHDGETSQLIASEVAIDLEHMKKRSIISGVARLESDRGPWALSFRTEDSEKTNLVTLKASVRDLVPSALARSLRQLAVAEPLDLKVNADVTIALSTKGDMISADFDIELGPGAIRVDPQSTDAITIDAARLQFVYDAATRRGTLSPSTFKSGNSFVTLAGTMDNVQAANDHSEWRYKVGATDGLAASEEFGVAPVRIDQWSATGRIVPHSGLIQLEQMNVKAGGAAVALSGELIAGSRSLNAKLDVASQSVSAATLKAMWLRAVMPGVRSVVGERIAGGNIASLTFSFASGSYVAASSAPTVGGKRLALLAEGTDVSVVALPGSAPVIAPRVVIRMENDQFEIDVPEAAVTTASGASVPLKAGRMTGTSMFTDRPLGEVSFRTTAALGSVLEVLTNHSAAQSGAPGLPIDKIDGKVDGQFSIKLPLVGNLDPLTVELQGNARVTEVRSKNKFGGIEVQSGTIDFELAGKKVKGSGQLILNGVLAKLDWERSLDAPPDTPQPVTVTATLDNADRNQLGIDVNEIVQGDVPVTITVLPTPGGEAGVHVSANLTPADLDIIDVAWRKPAGRPARLDFDVFPDAKTGRIELRGFKLTGDNIGINGVVWIGVDNTMREYNFPEMSLNVITRLQLTGRVRSDNVWDVQVTGSTFDAKEFFRSMLAVGDNGVPRQKPLKPNRGVDLKVNIATVLGNSDITLRGFTARLSRRNDKLTALDAKASFDNGRQFTAYLANEPGKPRRMIAESSDAGQALKLAGFYPNISGGALRLDVNLDGKGAAERTGVLRVDTFNVLADPVVSEVFSGAGGEGPAIEATQRSKKVVREVFEFERLLAPFSIGYGQFVLEDSFVRGPLLGATLRGKVDFKAQRVNLGGTYVPLQGLNNVLGDIPLLGQILSGPRGEGIFGMTFAIQGAMPNPQVIVNPLSLVAPGIFREMFQMTSPNASVQRREDRAPAAPAEKHVRASSSDISGGEPARGPRSAVPDANGVDGWSSETVVPSSPRPN